MGWADRANVINVHNVNGQGGPENEASSWSVARLSLEQSL